MACKHFGRSAAEESQMWRMPCVCVSKVDPTKEGKGGTATDDEFTPSQRRSKIRG